MKLQNPIDEGVIELNPIVLLIAGRLLLLISIFLSYFQGEIGFAIMNSIVFVVLLFIPWLARKDSRLYYVDFLSMLAFGGFYFLWTIPAIQATDGMILGYDKLFHMLGGACIALFVLCFIDKLSLQKQVVMTLGTVLVAGVMWEMFEWMLGQFPEPYRQTFNGWQDSSLDITADFFGGLIVVLWHILKVRRHFFNDNAD